MGRGSFTRETSGRSDASAAGFLTPGRDHFREKAERLAVKRGAKPSGDAFAPDAKSAANKDAFRAPVTAPQPVQVAAPEPQHAMRMLANGAALKIVASQPRIAEAGRKAGERKAAKSSTFVLVSSATVVETASPVVAPATTGDGGQGPLAIPSLSSPKFRTKRGGGGDGSGGSGGGAAPPRDRIFNQDDLAGVLVVLAILLLIGLYLVNLFRGNAPAAEEDPVLDVQSAATEAIAPPAPLPDPFGNQAIDLTPKSAPPPEAAEIVAAPPPPAAAEPAVAPAAVAAPAALEVRAHAYFCTDRSELTAVSAAALDKEIAAWGDLMAGKDLVVAGYADTRGEAVYNTWLGGERAKAVVNYLTAKGFHATALAVGELPDLTDNENCANQRRVDVRLADAAQEEPSRSCAPPAEFAALACLAAPPKKEPAASGPAALEEAAAPAE